MQEIALSLAVIFFLRFRIYFKNDQELTFYERFEWIHQKKLKGNRLIKKGKIDEAIEIYMEGLMGLDLQNGTLEVNIIKSLENQIYIFL